MKKFFKIALVLSSLALFSTACSNVRTTNLIGIYKSNNNSKEMMKLDSKGLVWFTTDEYNEENYSDEMLALNFIYYQSNADLYLEPWDLTSEKPSYDYSIDYKFLYNNPPETNSSVYEETNVSGNINLKFTKDKESIKCDVSYTIPNGVRFNITSSGTSTTKTLKSSGSITFNK